MWPVGPKSHLERVFGDVDSYNNSIRHVLRLPPCKCEFEYDSSNCSGSRRTVTAARHRLLHGLLSPKELAGCAAVSELDCAVDVWAVDNPIGSPTARRFAHSLTIFDIFIKWKDTRNHSPRDRGCERDLDVLSHILRAAAQSTKYWSISMANGWTSERRARQAALIQRWKPWERSTGPKTPEGKARVSRNAFKDGWRAQLRELSRLLREHDQTLRGSLKATPSANRSLITLPTRVFQGYMVGLWTMVARYHGPVSGLERSLLWPRLR